MLRDRTGRYQHASSYLDPEGQASRSLVGGKHMSSTALEPPPASQGKGLGDMAERLRGLGGLGLYLDGNGKENHPDGPTPGPKPPPWYRTLRCYLWVLVVVVSLSLVLVAILCQKKFINARRLTVFLGTNGQSQGDVVHLSHLVFFLLAAPSLWVTAWAVAWAAIQLAEMFLYGEVIGLWTSMRRMVAGVLFCINSLMWVFFMYHYVLCASIDCQDELGRNRDFLWVRTLLRRAVMSLLIFAVGNLLVSYVAKLLSIHLYTQTHFKSIKRELEQEYSLRSLAYPKQELRVRRTTGATPDPRRSYIRQLHWASVYLGMAGGVTNMHGLSGQIMDSEVTTAVAALREAFPQIRRRIKKVLKYQTLQDIEEPGSLEEEAACSATMQLMGHNMCVSPATAKALIKEGAEPQMPHLHTNLQLQRFCTKICVKTVKALLRSFQISPVDDDVEEMVMADVKLFAEALYFNIKGDTDRETLTLEDFSSFFDHCPVQGHKAQLCFDKDKDGQTTLGEMVLSAERILRERRFLAHSIADSDKVVTYMELFLRVVFNIVSVILSLLVFQVQLQIFFTALTASVAVFGLFLGESVKGMYENMVYLLVEHPYDVGDIIEVDGTYYRVLEINLQYTLLSKLGGQLVHHPSRKIRQSNVVNMTKSKTFGDSIVFIVDVNAVTPELLDDLHQRVREYEETSPGELKGELGGAGIMQAGPYPGTVEVQAFWTYAFAGNEFLRHFGVKAALQKKLVEVMKSHGVKFTLDPQVRRDVAPQ